MTIPVGMESNLLTGLAVYMSRSYVPFPILFGMGLSLLASWTPTGAYTARQTGIVLGTIPQTPDRVITLTAYGIDDSPNLSDSTIGVQVRCRAEGQDKRRVDDLDAAIFSLIHGKTALTLSTGAYVVQILRRSGPASLGPDGNGRWSVSSNYAATVHRPSANRT